MQTLTIERETPGRPDVVDETPKGALKSREDVDELRSQLATITDQLQGFTFAF